MTIQWTTVADSLVRHVWVNESGEETYVSPDFYADAGTPVDSETGEDLSYVRTEVRKDAFNLRATRERESEA